MKLIRHCLFIFFLVCSGVSQASLIEMRFASNTVSVGDTIVLDVFIIGHDEPVALFDFVLNYQSSHVLISDLSFSQALGDEDDVWSDWQHLPNQLAVFNMTWLDEHELTTQQTANETLLFTVTMQAIAAIPILTFNLDISPFDGLLNWFGDVIAFDTRDAELTILPTSTPVPVPASISLMLLGLMVMQRWRTQIR